MAYIGRGTENISNVEVLDNLTFNGSASYTLQKSSTNFVPSSANNLLISISGVVQQGNFTVSGSTITFDTTVASSDTCDWILHYGTGLITTVADGAITEAKLGSSAVTTAKINDGAITSAKLDSGLALGKIGQVVVTSDAMATTYITSTSSVAISGFTATITPSATSSKIFVLATYSYTQDGHNNGTLAFSQIYRGSTNIKGIVAGGDTANGDYGHAVVLSAYDSPNTTSAVTYNIHAQVQNSSSQFRPTNNSDTLTLMEVLA